MIKEIDFFNAFHAIDEKISNLWYDTIMNAVDEYYDKNVDMLEEPVLNKCKKFFIDGNFIERYLKLEYNYFEACAPYVFTNSFVELPLFVYKVRNDEDPKDINFVKNESGFLETSMFSTMVFREEAKGRGDYRAFTSDYCYFCVFNDDTCVVYGKVFSMNERIKNITDKLVLDAKVGFVRDKKASEDKINIL